MKDLLKQLFDNYDESLEYLIELGYVEKIIDPHTQEPGYKITTEGMEALYNQTRQN